MWKKCEMPVVSIYKMRGGKIVESQMFHADTAAVLRLLEQEA